MTPSWISDGAGIAVRTLALPWLLGARWVYSEPLDEIQSGARSLLERAKAAADEFFFATELLAGAPVAVLHASRIIEEVHAARQLYEGRGWLDHPARYHRAPPPLEAFRLTDAELHGCSCELLEFESEYEPWEGEPGRDRWLGYEPNRTAHATLFRHSGAERPWVVCLPGYRMGHRTVDFVGFRISWLYRDLGLNVAVPVMPFHGPRSVGRRSGDGYLTGDFLDTIHAQAQSVWDARRLIGWLRKREAPAIGAYGISLGSYTAAVLGAHEPDLDCVIAGIPAVDFVDLIHANTSGLATWLTGRLGFPWNDIRDILRVISPLALPMRVPRDRCFLFAGRFDCVAPPAHARALWEHWAQPKLVWYPGGHVSFFMEREVRDLIAEALRTTGFVTDAWAARRLPHFAEAEGF